MQKETASKRLGWFSVIFWAAGIVWFIYTTASHRESMRKFREQQLALAETELAEGCAWRAKRDQQEEEKAAAEAKRIAARAAAMGDKSSYEYAYQLLHPENDMRENSKVVIRLLRRDRELEDIPPRELALLYTAYNNLHERDGNAFEVAETLWRNAPGTDRAMRVITNAMHNKYMFSDPARIIQFVDEQLAANNGGEHELLKLKATALIHSDDSVPDIEKKKLVGDVLTRAMEFQELADPEYPGMRFDPTPNFIDYEQPFSSFLSIEEREALKLRLAAALKKRNVERPVIGE